MMTGSLFFNRQHSTTAAYPSKTKMDPRKLRRYSSADENQAKEKIFTKYDPTASDSDSGIEDSDQQIVNDTLKSTNNVEEENSSPCFGPCEDEDVEEEELTPTANQEFQYPEEDPERIFRDLRLASQISHETKKEFCRDTSAVFHAEFARLIGLPISLKYPGVCYHLFTEEGAGGSDPSKWPNFACIKLDNAKAQFRCPNPQCRRLWTSMRARISFAISYPDPRGFVVLKIFGQNCQTCETSADALWYMEEVCRVMENLSQSIFQTFFPGDMTYDFPQSREMIVPTTKYSQRIRHDPHQRKGKMQAQHDHNHCEACQRGLCFN